MAHVTTSLRAQDQAAKGDQYTDKLQSKRSSLRLSGLLSRHKPQKAETDKDPEKPVKRDLQVPLYRRYASFRSRTPSARDGSTTPKSVGKDGMASTAEVETKNLPEGAGVEQTESADQPKESETAFPTSSDSKAEKPLPEPKGEPSRPRRLSVKVSKFLGALPGKTKEKDDSDTNGADEGSGRRRLFEKVGNLVNRKPKATPEAATEPEVKVEGSTEGEAREDVATEDKDAPAVPSKTEGGITEESREEVKPTGEIKAQEASHPAAKPLKAPPPSAANRATKLARRLSAGALDVVFRSRTKGNAKGTEGGGPPVSKASVAAQDLASHPTEAEKAKVEEVKSNSDATDPDPPATAIEPSDDKVLPPPPPAEEAKSANTKEKAPPSAFKDAAKVARRLSTGLFKKPNASSSDLHDIKTAESTAAAESKSVIETSSATEKATELVRKVSRRAQGAVAKARAKVKTEGKQKPAAPVLEAKPAPSTAEEQPAGAEASAPAPPAETIPESKDEAPATEKAEGTSPESPGEVNKDSKATATAKEEDKELPPPPSSFSLGGITRRLSGTVSGVFGYGATAETATPPEQSTAEGSSPSKDNKEGEPSPAADIKEGEPTLAADVKDEPTSSEAAPAPEGAESGAEATSPVVPAREEANPAQEGSAPEQAPPVDKALPSPPPPSASESIAKIGKLTRRLSNRVSTRVGSAIRSATASSKVEAHSGEVEKQTPPEVASAKEKVEGTSSEKEAKPAEGADSAGAPTSNEQDTPLPAAAVAETSAPPVEGAPTTPTSTAPGAFKASRSKLGRRLSARIGDVFRSKAPPVPDKEAAKDDATPSGGEASEVKAEPDDPAKAPASKEDGPKEVGEKKEAEAEEEPTPVATEGEGLKDEAAPELPATEASQPKTPSVNEASQVDAEASPDKPLPAKPSRSIRAKDVAVDVGRQLSIKASGALKAARPKLEEIVAKAPSAFKSSDKGKEREKVDGAEPDDVAQVDGFGKRISKRVVDGIRGLNHKQGGSGSDAKAAKEGDGDEDWEEVEADGGAKPAAVDSKTKPLVEEGPRRSGEPTSAEDVKGASVEAVEGAATSTSKDAPKVEQLKDEEAKSGRPLSSLVTGIFKPKHKLEPPLPPTEVNHAHEGGSTTDSRDGKRRRRISLGFGTKKSKKAADAKREAAIGSGSAVSLPPPAVPPKDGEDEKEQVPEVPKTPTKESKEQVPEAPETPTKEPPLAAPEPLIEEKVQVTEVEVTAKSA